MRFLLTLLFAFSFLTSQAQLWSNSFEEALADAKTEDKPVVLVFSGSDWCGPCIRFKKKILESDDFKSFAAENYVLYNADFPRKKKNQLPFDKLNSNKSLAERYNPRGFFPLVVVLNEKETILGETGFDTRKSPQDYIALFNDFIQ